jgi:hypothetical protein
MDEGGAFNESLGGNAIMRSSNAWTVVPNWPAPTMSLQTRWLKTQDRNAFGVPELDKELVFVDLTV